MIFLFLCLLYGEVRAQEENSFRVVFYNVENLFDTRKDSLTADDDFTPGGKQHWNLERYNRKLLHISRALMAAGGEALPAIIGLAEIENRKVLSDLSHKTGLIDGDYDIVHADSPDPRGIDVALLYRKGVFRVLNYSFLNVSLKGGEKTRDILYCKGVFREKDTVFFFVCHFPSMRGGEARSEWKRMKAASVIRSKVDSIQGVCSEAMILIMGDLNGRANSPAQRVLGALNPDTPELFSTALYNTGYHLLGKQKGSYRYRGEWQTLDHILVSGVLLEGEASLCAPRKMGVCDADFLLEEERGTFGLRPRPTYRGPRYIGGYSDHLPVFIDLIKKTKVNALKRSCPNP